MAEQAQQVSTEQPASTEAPQTENTLEQVYSEFNVEAEAQSFQPQQTQQQPQQTAQETLPAVPDPVLDPNGFKTWQAAQSGEIQKKLASMEAFQRQLAVSEINRREAEEVKTLVSDLNKVVGLPEADADLIEFALAKQVRSDPKFAAIYQKRHQNPKAWNAATKAMGEQLQKKFSVRADPQLAENQKALKQAQQSSATTKQTNPEEDRFAGKTGAAFDKEWQSYIGRGTL